MARKVIEKFEIGGISVEIGPAISKDAGLVLVARHIRESEWFKLLVDRLLAAIATSPRRCSGFKKRSKLETGLLALIGGLVMGRRNPNAIARSFILDPLWRVTIGRFFNQRDLSRLVELLAAVGEGPLRRALLASAQTGQDHLELDMDSSVLELYGTQEWGGYNTHYQTFGYHAGWAIDIRTGKLAALWLNEGNAFTATGQADQLTWILDQGAQVNLARFDAGLIGPDMLQAIEGRVERFVCRIKSNEVLDRFASPMEPLGPLYAGAKSYAEFSYGAETWEKQQRVVVRFQAPDGPDGELVLFADPERFYFVTSLEECPAEVVATYLRRGESERVFGEFKGTLEPTFRHQEVRKNGVWALLVALAYNVLGDLRDQIPKPEKPAKVRVEHRPDFLPEPWVFGFHRLLDGLTQPVRPLLDRFRDMALRVSGELRKVGEHLHLYVQPDILAPVWFPAIARE
jgi:hypothetical protein